jgi:hypothetical protein
MLCAHISTACPVQMATLPIYSRCVLNVHESCSACHQDVLRVMEWLELRAAGKDGRLLPQLLFHIGFRIEYSRPSAACT